ncbi:MAG: caspase family protein [Thermoguttaceae bacterium]|nr:caspase family protein [Thermoguttaceae bacterium]
MSGNKGRRVGNVRGWSGRLAVAALTLATTGAWLAPVEAGEGGIDVVPAANRIFHDADGNLAYVGDIDCEKTAASAKDGGKPERVFWSDGGSYPYALLSEEDRTFVDAELARVAEMAANLIEEEAEARKRIEFYDADGNLVFTGRIVCEKTAATAKDGGKPERVFWSKRRGGGIGFVRKDGGTVSVSQESTPVGSFPYALLSADDQALVDAELAAYAEQKAAEEKERREREEATTKAVAEARDNWAKASTAPVGFERVQGDIYSLHIGCGSYESGFAPLKGPAEDAKLLRERLIACGVAKERTYVLTERQATRKNILRALDALNTVTKPGDMIWITFSGQGIEIDGEAYWAAHDSKVSDLAGTCVSISEVVERLNAMPGRVKVVLNDACRAPEENKSTHRALKKVKVNQQAFAPDTFLINACQAGGLAYEFKDKTYGKFKDIPYGIFSYYFAEGLTEKGDANGDGVVTLMEAFQFAKAHTRAEVWTTYGAEQTPEFYGPLTDVAVYDMNAAPQETQESK